MAEVEENAMVSEEGDAPFVAQNDVGDAELECFLRGSVAGAVVQAEGGAEGGTGYSASTTSIDTKVLSQFHSYLGATADFSLLSNWKLFIEGKAEASKANFDATGVHLTCKGTVFYHDLAGARRIIKAKCEWVGDEVWRTFKREVMVMVKSNDLPLYSKVRR